jgi:hypothetical protein
MPRFTVKQRYTAYRDGKQFGPWEPDSEIELDAPDAEWVERDSPGTLAEIKPKAQGKTR